MQQRARLSHLESFRRDLNGVLLATDVAARGLDVPAVEHVVHFSLPASTESFVHRSGRTARGERSGLALALIGPTDDRAYQRLCRVLGIPTGLAEFPSDANISREVAARVALARSIANEQASIDIESAQQSWLVSTAAAAGLEIDDATAAEVGGFGEALTSQKKGARKPRGDADADADADGIGEDEVTAHLSADDVAAARADAKARRQRLAALGASLRARLDVPLIPSGVSRKYVTSNPALGQAAHPMQALVHVDASGPAAAVRSGSALVAPRVSMPDFGRGALGRSVSTGSALGALKTSRHVHVPGVRAAVKKNAAANKARLAKEKRRAKQSSKGGASSSAPAAE
jgi:superfamily II DNA/RNA helicase